VSTKFKTLSADSIRYLVVHCAATPPEMDIGAKEIDLWHRQRGWSGIGYHFVIRRDGRVEAGRPLDRPGAHAQGFNLLSWGICLVGGVTEAGANGDAENNFTDAQFEALESTLRWLQQLAPEAVVLGHRDLPSPHARLKACPSFDAQGWWAAVNSEE